MKPNLERNVGCGSLLMICAISGLLAGCGQNMLPRRLPFAIAEFQVGSFSVAQISEPLGMILFGTRPRTEAAKARHNLVCELFFSVLPLNGRKYSPTRYRLVKTYWLLRENIQDAECKKLLEFYDYDRALVILRKTSEATGNSIFTADKGPFLLAFAPPKSGESARSLVVNMTCLGDEDEFERALLSWRRDIVADPSAWKQKLDIGRLRLIADAILGKCGRPFRVLADIFL